MIDESLPARRYAPAPDVVLKCWDEGAGVAYNPRLASTHLVSADGVAVLQNVRDADAGITVHELASLLDGGAGTNDEFLAHLQDLLDGLTQTGLLRTLDSC